MDNEGGSERASIGVQGGRLAARLLLTTVATAFAGAVANFFYELLFRPDLGPPILRAAVAIVWTGPFILVGLIVLGLPVSYLLKRMSFENSASYALTGAIAGVAYGVTLTGLHHAEMLTGVALFGAGSALFWWWLRPRG